MCADTARSFTMGNPQSTGVTPSNKKRVSVVQCPACQTKFAVDSSAIAAVQHPRFHCSRCDNVFSIGSLLEDAEHQSAMPPSQQPITQATQQPAHQPTATSTIPSTLDFFENATQSSVFGIDESGEDFAASVMNDEPFTASDLPQDIFNFENIPTEPSNDAKIGAHLFDVGLTGTQSFDEEPMGYGSLSRADHVAIRHNESQHKEADTSIDPLLHKAPPKTPPSYKILLAPSIASVVLFGLIAALSVISPHTIAVLSGNLIASKEHALPTDLYVRKASLKRIVLDSGETVSVITGTVKNNSTKPVKELFLEGAIFDPKSKLLAKKKAHAASALTKSRIQSLTPHMLDELQNAKPARTFSLKPKQEEEFTIVIPEPQSLSALPPASFVTRIYSGRVEL